MRPASSHVLEVRDLWRSFDGFPALRGVTLSLHVGERHAVIGPNGAGKTTFFDLITGHLEPDRGGVSFEGQPIAGLAPHRIVRLGVARSFQRINIYPRMTVADNVRVALIARDGQEQNLVVPACGLAADETESLLARAGLGDQATRDAGELGYGKQKQLELALALAAQPRLLLLDEPTAGMSPAETAVATELLHEIQRERRFTLLFTEHDMGVVFGMADRISVLHQGEIIASGTPDAVRQDPRVRRVYLGQADHA